MFSLCFPLIFLINNYAANSKWKKHVHFYLFAEPNTCKLELFTKLKRGEIRSDDSPDCDIALTHHLLLARFTHLRLSVIFKKRRSITHTAAFRSRAANTWASDTVRLVPHSIRFHEKFDVPLIRSEQFHHDFAATEFHWRRRI